MCLCVYLAAGDLTVSLPDGLTTLDGIHLQLTPANVVCPNVQISGIDTSNINNITLQVTHDCLMNGLLLLVMNPVFSSIHCLLLILSRDTVATDFPTHPVYNLSSVFHRVYAAIDSGWDVD